MNNLKDVEQRRATIIRRVIRRLKWSKKCAGEQNYDRSYMHLLKALELLGESSRVEDLA